MNAVISWSWVFFHGASYGKVWNPWQLLAEGMMNLYELQSAKQHPVPWLLGEEDLILLLVAILFLSHGVKLQIPIAQWTHTFGHSYDQKHGRTIHSGSE